MSELAPPHENDAAEPAATEVESQSTPQNGGAEVLSAPAPVAVQPAPRVVEHDDEPKAEIHVTEQNAGAIMDRLLREMGTSGETSEKVHGHGRATDLHINPGRSADYRIERVIRALKTKPLTQQDVELLSNALMNEHQRARFERNHCIDFSYHLDRDRFRINIVQSFIGRSISIRRFEEIRDFDDYHLPRSYLRIAEQHRGFVVMSGATGSGKTTSIAAMLDYVNKKYARKIVTIEDPIEYVYVPKKSIVVQLEIGDEGIPNEEIALRNLVRMDPDVGLAGEMRDRASLEAALKTAQAGHLIFGTLHCEGVGQAFDRILAYYDRTEQMRILGTLADNLAAIINQRLLPCLKPGVDVVPAYEIFIPNPLTRRYIRELRYQDAIAEMEKPAMKELGCVTYVDCLYNLVIDEWVDYHIAAEHAGGQAEKLQSRLKGIELK